MSRIKIIFGLIATFFIFLFPSLTRQVPASPSANSGSVSGIVLDGSGKPLPSATVYAMPETDMRRQFHTKSNSEGEFVLGGLAEGSFFFSAFKESDGYPYNFFSFFLSPGEKTPVKVQVRAGESTKDVKIQLGQRAARLDIQITTEDGKPVEGASLFFTRPDQPGRYGRGARAAESILVPPVPFHLEVQAKGYRVWQDAVAPKPGETLALTIRLVPIT